MEPIADDRGYYIKLHHDVPIAVLLPSLIEVPLCKYCLEPTVSVGCHGICENCGWQYGCGD